MDDFRFQLEDINKNVVSTTLTSFDKTNLGKIKSSSEKSKFAGLVIRQGKLKNENGIIYAFTSNPEFVKSSKKFKSRLEQTLCSLVYIEESINTAVEKQNKKTSRLLHNLITLNAHNIQEVYSIIPQDTFEKNYVNKERISTLTKIIEEEKFEIALSLLRIAKNNAGMKVEFSVFKKLFESSPELSYQYHKLHSVLLNLFYPFFPDFTDKGVKVDVCKSTESAFFDYESMHVAFYHLIDNAAKYIKPDSTLEILINRPDNENKINIQFVMYSLEITKEEEAYIFEEGYSGLLPQKLGKAGNGLGLSRVRSILEINNGSINIFSNFSDVDKKMGVTYQKNTVVVTLPLAQ